MTIAIATMGKFLPTVGLREVRTRGGIDSGVALPPPQPMVFITDIEEKEFDYPFVQVYDIKNGKNGNGIVEVIELTNGDNND